MRVLRRKVVLQTFALAWLCTSHARADEDAPACDPSDSYCEIRWGVAVEGGLGLGVDAALAFWGGLVGVHVSLLGFRFGPNFVNLPQQLWMNVGSSRLVLEQVLSVSYLFSM